MAEEYDVAIIGAGIGGASLAANLGSGLKVAILEAEAFPGYHTSGRSAAFYSESYGGPVVQPLTTASHPCFLAAEAETGEAWLGAARRALYVGRAHQLEALREMQALFPAVEMQLIGPQQVAAHAPMLRPEWTAGGLWEPGVRDINTATMHQAFLRTFRRNGGVLKTGWRVTGLAREAGGWLISSAAEDIRARVVVNAAGAWADDVARLAGIPPIGLMPLRRTLVVLRVPQAEYRADAPLVLDVDGSFYFKPEAGGRLWLSPHDEIPTDPCDAAPEDMDVAVAIDRFEHVVDWRVAALEHKWAGLRSFAPDRLPVYGFDPRVEGFFWCAGQGGFGIQTAPAAARLAAALLTGRAPDPSISGIDAARYSPARFGQDSGEA